MCKKTTELKQFLKIKVTKSLTYSFTLNTSQLTTKKKKRKIKSKKQLIYQSLVINPVCSQGFLVLSEVLRSKATDESFQLVCLVNTSQSNKNQRLVQSLFGVQKVCKVIIKQWTEKDNRQKNNHLNYSY